MFFYYLNFTGYRAACNELMTATHFAKAGLEALRAFRSAFWFLKSTTHLPFLRDFWKSCAPDSGTQFAQLCPNLWVPYQPPQVVPLVHSAPSFLLSGFPGAHHHRGSFRTWRLDQERLEGQPGVQVQPSPSKTVTLQRQPRPSPSLAASGEMPCCQGFLTQEHLHKAMLNYNNWLHLGDGFNIRMRLTVLYYSTVWTGSGVFWLEAAHWCSLKLLLCSQFSALEFPSVFRREWNLLETLQFCFWFHVHCANDFRTRLPFPLQKLSF